MKRITLIARIGTTPNIDWNYTSSASMRVAFLNSVTALKFALDVAVSETQMDIERVIVDRTGTAEEFLNLLTDLPTAFTGDVLMIRNDGNGFLSATGRGGDRVLYALIGRDVRFYLETHDLVTGRAVLETAQLRAIA